MLLALESISNGAFLVAPQYFFRHILLASANKHLGLCLEHHLTENIFDILILVILTVALVHLCTRLLHPPSQSAEIVCFNASLSY